MSLAMTHFLLANYQIFLCCYISFKIFKTYTVLNMSSVHQLTMDIYKSFYLILQAERDILRFEEEIRSLSNFLI